MPLISNNCDRIIIILETFFIGLITIYSGWAISNSSFTNSIPSIILIGIGLTFILFGLVFSCKAPHRIEYHRIDSIV